MCVSYNQIGAEEAKALAAALASGQCPQGLQVNLFSNQISGEGAKALATALASGQCPAGLKLSLENNELSAALLASINFLLKENEIRHAALSCLTLQQGLKQQSLPLAKLPQAVANHLYLFVPAERLSKKEEAYFVTKIQTAAATKSWLATSTFFQRKNNPQREINIKQAFKLK